MGPSTGLLVLLLAGLASANPSKDFIITDKQFPEAFVIYSSYHDIVNIFCPLNALNFPDQIDPATMTGNDKYVFFIEADINNGEYDFKGTYVIKNKKVTKLLDNGRDFAAKMSGSTKNVYIAATDGVYRYNPEHNNVEKYGSVTETPVGIAVVEDPEFLYVLSENHRLYKISNHGNDQEIVRGVKDVVQIVLDHDDNLFYLDTKKDVYVLTKDGVVTKIEGLPANPKFAKLIRPVYSAGKGVPFISDRKVYQLSPEGTSVVDNIYFQVRPTAVAVGPQAIQYYAHDEKIYEYNIHVIMPSSGDNRTYKMKNSLFNFP